MATMGRRCSICSDPARRRAVDSELLGGSTVAEVVRLYAGSLGFSEAAAYRHARHAHDASEALSAPAPDGETPADNIRALVRVQKHLLGMLDRAEAKGDDKTAALAGDRLRAVIHEANDILGYDPQTYTNELAAAQGFVRSVVRAARVDPSTVAALAVAFEQLGDHHNAAELSTVASHYSSTQ